MTPQVCPYCRSEVSAQQAACEQCGAALPGDFLSRGVPSQRSQVA